MPDYTAHLGDPDTDPDPRELADLSLNDLGNARRLLARHGVDMLSVDHIGWHVWDGRRFDREAGNAEAMKRCFDVVDAMALEVAALSADPVLSRVVMDAEDDPLGSDLDQAAARPKRRRTAAEVRAAALAKHRVASGNAGKINGMMKLAEPLKRIAAMKLDADKLAFTAQNGVLRLSRSVQGEPGEDIPMHLQTGFSRADLGTKLAGAAYDPTSRCPKFEAFLEGIMPSPAVRGFLQRFFGYCLTGETFEQVFLVFYGKGANGKSQLLIAIRAAMGDYAMTSDIKTFLSDDKSNGANARPDIARLPGVRLVVASEPEQGQALDESLIKTITGGEMMVTRNLFRDMFEFEPIFKPILSTNYKIRIRGTDNGIWRRVLLVPFEQTITADRDIKDLGKQLGAEEGSGILNWMLDGYADWRAQGLSPPPEIRDATDEYRAESDPIGMFVRECMEIVLADTKNELAVRVYEIYVQWCIEAGYDPVKRNMLGRKLTDRGIHRGKSSNATYSNVVLTPDAYELERRAHERMNSRYPSRSSEPPGEVSEVPS